MTGTKKKKTHPPKHQENEKHPPLPPPSPPPPPHLTKPIKMNNKNNNKKSVQSELFTVDFVKVWDMGESEQWHRPEGIQTKLDLWESRYSKPVSTFHSDPLVSSTQTSIIHWSTRTIQCVYETTASKLKRAYT